MQHFLTIPMPLRLTAMLLVGICAGSLINLGIYRLAWNRRSISPWSRPDPRAGRRRWFYFIPVLGWLGRRHESAVYGPGFWIRPMLLELGTGAALALLYWWEVGTLGLMPIDLAAPPVHSSVPAMAQHQYLAHAILLVLMLVATWIDVDEKTIPDAITIPGTVCGLVLAVVSHCYFLPGRPLGPWANCLWFSAPADPVPWSDPTWFSGTALAAALAGFWAWCLAVLPRSWHGRHGVVRAIQLLCVRLRRDWTAYAILALGVAGSIGIVVLWHRAAPMDLRHPADPLRWLSLLTALTGMVTGAGMIWSIRVVGSAVLRREAMGFGDVTLMAMIGAFIGWQPAVIVFFLAPFFGLIVGGLTLLFRGDTEIAYGPFLCLATLVTVVAWRPIWFGCPISNAFFLGWQMLAFFALCLPLIFVLLPLVRWGLSFIRQE